jgi:ATP-dependent protease ClpP protease subunit
VDDRPHSERREEGEGRVTERTSFKVLNQSDWALIGIIDEEAAMEMYRAVCATPKTREPLLLIDSAGGFTGLTCGLIHHIRKKFPTFETRVVGEAMSAAVDLVLAGYTRSAVPTAMFFTHTATANWEVRPYNADQMAAVLRSQDEWMYKLYRKLTKKKSLKFWRDFFMRDRFFDAKEALDLGILTHLL